MLMLAFYYWSSCRGLKAWTCLNVAIRSAQLMGLQYDADLDDMLSSRSLASRQETQYFGKDLQRRSSQIGSTDDAFVQQEMRRRTFWSCFVLDRCFSSGKYRLQALHVADFRVQLPASEHAFLFGGKVRTLLLGEGRDEVASRQELQNWRREQQATAIGNPTYANGNEEEHGRWEYGADEGLLSRYVKILEIYGRVIRWLCSGRGK